MGEGGDEALEEAGSLAVQFACNPRLGQQGSLQVQI